MSTYTTEVRYICENAAGLLESAGFNDVESIIEKAAPKIFTNFPLFDEKYRLTLETKILRHFYTREIGYETVGLWKLKLATKLNEIMPYYNQMYKSELLEFNPFYDVDLTRTHSGKRDSDQSSTKNTSGNVETSENVDYAGSSNVSGTDSGTVDVLNNTQSMYSDTPQGAITDLIAGRYLTNAQVDSVTGKTTSSGTNSSNTRDEHTQGRDVNTDTSSKETGSVTVKDVDSYLETVKGKQGTGSYMELLQKYRETFLNIDMMIIEELEDLFMQLW